MRLWHIDILKYLPKSQILSQWRELNSVFKKQDKHILINYIYNYSKEYLYVYTEELLGEFVKRNYKVKSFDNFNNYFADIKDKIKQEYNSHIPNAQEKMKQKYRYKEHNDEYLKICYYNLKEKHLRGQKDFNESIFDKLDNYVFDKFKGRI